MRIILKNDFFWKQELIYKKEEMRINFLFNFWNALLIFLKGFVFFFLSNYGFYIIKKLKNDTGLITGEKEGK